MPVAFIMDFDGGTSEQYDAVVEEMQLGGRMPEGGLYHAAGATDSGWRVVDVWEADEPFQAFTESQIVPVTQRHGLAAPRIRRLEVDQVRPGASAGRSAAFLQIVRMPGLTSDAFHAADAKVLPLPDGLVFHVNGPDEGGWFVIDTWRTKQERDAFIQERVMPVFANAPLSGEPAFEEMAVHNTLVRPIATA